MWAFAVSAWQFHTKNTSIWHLSGQSEKRILPGSCCSIGQLNRVTLSLVNCRLGLRATSSPLPLKQPDRYQLCSWIIQLFLQGRGWRGGSVRRRSFDGGNGRAALLGEISPGIHSAFDRYRLYYHWHVIWRRRRGWRLIDELLAGNSAHSIFSAVGRNTERNNLPVSLLGLNKGGEDMWRHTYLRLFTLNLLHFNKTFLLWLLCDGQSY